MARPKSFKISDLKYEAGQVKRHFLNEARRGRLDKVNKKEIFLFIAARPKINLRSDRMLWQGEAKEYLDKWFNNLETEIKQVILADEQAAQDSNQEEGIYTSTILQKELDYQKKIVKALKNALDEALSENERLRTKLIEKHGFIDNV